MEKQNIISTEEEQKILLQEENQSAVVSLQKSTESPLLKKVRQKFEITALISLLFGVFFTLSFYKAEAGLNIVFFTVVMISLLLFVMKQFELPMKKGTFLYYLGSLMAGISSSLTSSDELQLINLVLSICLLNLSLLHQLHQVKEWDVQRYLGQMFGMLFLGIASIGMPFTDGLHYLKRTKLFRSDKARNILVGLLISIPLLWVIIMLLSEADMIFGDMTREVTEHIFSSEIIAITFMVLFGFFSCYCILCGAASQTGRAERSRRKGASSIAITVLLLIALLYLVFCGLQLMYLFSNGLFALPEGYTFAEYARRGFFELLAIAVINVTLMLITTAYFEESPHLRRLLTLMTICTYIMIGSAAYRMLLYIDAYHLTFLRLFVLLALVILAFLLGGVIVSVYRKSFPLFRYSIAVIVVWYLAFSFSKPDYQIASYLEEHKQVLSSEDAAYLVYDLSMDAAPIILPLLSDASRWTAAAMQGVENSAEFDYNEDDWTDQLYSVDYYRNIYYETLDRMNEGRDIRDYNFSAAKAKNLVKKYPK